MADSPSTSEVVRRLHDSRPPATDNFTYLTIIDQYMSPEILPALLEILQDAALTKEIGWDLVEMLINVPGGEPCLETVARLGNPREVILKVLEVLERVTSEENEGAEEEDSEAAPHDKSSSGAGAMTSKFITLVGMLGILHKRLEVRAPSRFLHTTLQTVLRAYIPTPEMTAAVIGFVRAVSPSTRPPLPSRKSSTTLSTPFECSDPTKSAPDPEAEAAGPVEEELITRLLQAFITYVIEAYVNRNDLAWAPRLLEFYNPDKIVPGRRSMLQSFREHQKLLARDALIGQLAALAGDLGLAGFSSEKITQQCKAPLDQEPLAADPDPEHLEDIKLSTTGFWCLTAYWVFASEVFDSTNAKPDMYIFPDHSDLMQLLVDDAPQARIIANPGVVDALLVLGLWLHENSRLVARAGVERPDFMAYHHLLTLCAVFHPALHTRNAATRLAGLVLHADPDDDDRLRILEDLLENCVFASMQACAVTWLREELVLAAERKSKESCFASSKCIDALQYALFPHLADELRTDDAGELAEFWAQGRAFHLQVANFAYLLFAGKAFSHLVPEGMAAAVEQRYVEPLIRAAKVLQGVSEKAEEGGSDGGLDSSMELGILIDRLESLPL